MLYPFISIGLTAVFIIYLLYAGLVKKNLRSQLHTVVFPGLFFLIAWFVMFFLFLR